MVLQRIYFNKTGMEKVLILSCLFSTALALFRVLYTGHLLFLFLLWNLFLAFVPYQLSKYINSQVQEKVKKLKLVFLYVAWLLFIPNSFYIITDLFHLQDRPLVPLWFDLALILSFSWNGLLFGVLSVRQMERILEQQWKIKNELFFIYPLMCLNALGIYIGRYLRFNSWDVLTNPFQLAGDIMYLVIHPIRNRFDWSMIICFSVLMTLMYIAVKRISNEEKGIRN